VHCAHAATEVLLIHSTIKKANAHLVVPRVTLIGASTHFPNKGRKLDYYMSLHAQILRPCSLPHPNLKYFLLHSSHQIFRRMHEALNVGKKDN
jgi:hypothetical protein